MRTSAKLMLLPPDAQVSQPASMLAPHVHDLHVEIQRKIASSDDNYKLSANVRCSVNFEIGDFVMARIRPE